MIIKTQTATKNINHQIRKEVSMAYRLIRRCTLLNRTPPENFDEFKPAPWKGMLVWAGMLAFCLLAWAMVGMFIFPTKGHTQSIVAIAESQIGRGEIGGNNQGPFVERYTRGQDVAWCAGFVSWVRFQAGYRGDYFLSARSYWTAYRDSRVKSPHPGDLIVFARGAHYGHVGIVEKVNGKIIVTIEGNVGRYPAKVKRETYTLGHIKHLLGFVRIS